MCPLISVIIPVYNVEKYIQKCIESVIKQTYENLEIILVDDGSLDKCGIICDYYKDIDSRIKVIHKKNGGLSDARNVGIDIANGEYIMFLDSDDYISIDICEYLYNLISTYKAEISICGFYEAYEDKIIEPIYKDKLLIMDGKEGIKEILKEKNFNTSAWAKLYKSSLFKDIRFPYGKISEDLFTIYRIFDRSSKIVFGYEPKYYYVQSPNSIMRSSFNLKKLDTLEALSQIKIFIKNKYPDLEELAINRYVRYNISYVKEMIECNYENNEITEKLIYNIKPYIRKYVKSDYRFTSKLFGIFISINYKCTKKLYKFVMEIKNIIIK